MSKAILVIDMPNSCMDCPLCASYEIVSSVEEYWCDIANKNVNQDGRPDWCPLQEAPEEQLVWGDDSDWELGYNSCLREIVGR